MLILCKHLIPLFEECSYNDGFEHWRQSSSVMKLSLFHWNHAITVRRSISWGISELGLSCVPCESVQLAPRASAIQVIVCLVSDRPCVMSRDTSMKRSVVLHQTTASVLWLFWCVSDHLISGYFRAVRTVHMMASFTQMLLQKYLFHFTDKIFACATSKFAIGDQLCSYWVCVCVLVCYIEGLRGCSQLTAMHHSVISSAYHLSVSAVCALLLDLRAVNA